MDGKPTEVPNNDLPDVDKYHLRDIIKTVPRDPEDRELVSAPTPDAGEVKVDIIAVKPADPSANDTVNGQPVHDKPFLTDEEIQKDDVKVINDDSTKKPLQEKSNFGPMIGSFFSYVKDKVWLGILNTIIPMVRNLVYQFEVQRQNAEDFYQMQADLLQMNAMDLQYNNTLSDSEKNVIYKKQMAQVAKFKKHANNLSIDNKTSEVMSGKKVAEEAKKFKADDIDTYEDESDIYSNSSLF